MRKLILAVSVAVFSFVVWAPSADSASSPREKLLQGEFEVGPYGRMVARDTGDEWPEGEPPPWMPARGVGSPEVAYEAPFGIEEGHCDRKAIGAALGRLVIRPSVGEAKNEEPAPSRITLIEGGGVDRILDRVDRACAGQALEHARTHTTVAWQNPKRHTAFEVTPVRHYRSEAGEYCRDYYTIATVGGVMRKVYGTACRRSDGVWKVSE